MGFMTEVSILNDRWDEIRRNPSIFVEQLYDAACGSGFQRGQTPYVIGQTTVCPSHHADDLKVYYSKHNSFFEACPTLRNRLNSGRDIRLSERDARELIYQADCLREMKKYLDWCLKETNRQLREIEVE